MQRRACDSSASPDSGLRNDSSTAEKPERLISDRDLDLVVNGMPSVAIVS